MGSSTWASAVVVVAVSSRFFLLFYLFCFSFNYETLRIGTCCHLVDKLIIAKKIKVQTQTVCLTVKYVPKIYLSFDANS